MDVRRLVGENVRRLRLAKDFSQEQLAERMGVDRAYISGLEAGQRNPTIITLWHTAEALDVKISDLFEPEQTHQKPQSRKRAPRRVKP
jgi:transcriptional regulator with XRE-family HTH domain